jgi:hypothetical protein
MVVLAGNDPQARAVFQGSHHHVDPARRDRESELLSEDLADGVEREREQPPEANRVPVPVAAAAALAGDGPEVRGSLSMKFNLRSGKERTHSVAPSQTRMPAPTKKTGIL